MRRRLLFVLLPLLAPTAALAQATTATAQRTQHTAAAAGSPAWYDSGFELVEAELAFDTVAAAATATALAAVARDHQHGDEALVAAALTELAEVLREGPAAATHTDGLKGNDDQLPPRLGARYHAARARTLWFADQPAPVLAHGLAALRLARAAGDELLLLRCTWILFGIVEREDAAVAATLLAATERAATAAYAAPFAPFRALNAYWRSASGMSFEQRRAAIAAMAGLAQTAGDLQTLGMVEWERAVLAAETDDLPTAFAAFASAGEVAGRAGHRRDAATSQHLAAALALDHGQIPHCEQLLDDAARAIEGRGFPDVAVAVAHLRLRLATARDDRPAIVAATAALDTLRRAESERRRGYPLLRDQLLAPERDRIARERQADADQARAERTLTTVAWSAGGLAALALAVAFAITLQSRRRLHRANARLQAEMARAEVEAKARIEVEQRMRRLERSESLGLIASGVAHDFNNLMAGVLGNAELLRQDEPDAERGRMLAAIADAGERGARLCSQLQTYSDDDELALSPLDLCQLVRDLQAVCATAAGSGIAVAVAAGPATLDVAADRTQVEQALLNLVTNARDAGARHVTVRAERVAMTAGDWTGVFVRGDARPGEFACIEVEDDGEGISGALLERVFDPFFTTRFPGRGLGLAVVLGAMRRHDGIIAVGSRPGVGSRFRLFLPLDQASRPRPVLLPRRPVPLHAVTPSMDVLVVDDEACVRDYIRRALTVRGHRVAATADGTAAVAALATLGGSARAIALIDLSMPIVDGRAVVKALRALRTPPAIVLMSGHASAHLAATARELDVDGTLAKPFPPAEMEQALAQALQEHARRTGAPRDARFDASART